jgi:hypothetical protein
LIGVESVDNVAQHIELVYEAIVDALQKAAMIIPKKPVNFYKYWWDAKLDDLKEKSITAHNIWSAMGKPKQGDIFINMRKAKVEYKREIKIKELSDLNYFSDELNDALTRKDMTSFWKTWNGKFKKNSGRVQVIDGCCNEASISNVFATFF